MASSLLLGLLYFFPVSPDLVDVVDLDISKNVGVSPNKLICQLLADGLEIKSTPFLAQLRVEHDLQEYVTQFFRQFDVILGLNGVEKFVNFLNRMPPQGLVVLLSIPRTAIGSPQGSHDLKDLTYRRGFPRRRLRHDSSKSEDDQIIPVYDFRFALELCAKAF